ncbi:MAG TPA: D-glycero-beta-D-manno-heptose-7-phosphate kinase [Candidatus Binatia bacterium]|nr:D-glycero-beta-D-manno-heptose-7-phosphate kinase [Candidatus Binatia bacterium]
MFKELDRTIEAVKREFGRPQILVVGDLILDRYLWGRVERISPEAPVPVVHLEHRAHTPGGAANVACNLARLGCQVSLAGIIGDDDDGRDLIETLANFDVETSAIQIVRGRPTTVKTRVVGGHQQMLRLDSEDRSALAPSECQRLLDALLPTVSRYSALVLSDYDKGTLGEDVCKRLIVGAKEASISVFVDPKGLSYRKYAGATMICPNRSEVAMATGTSPDNLSLLFEKTEELRSNLGIDFVALTLSDLGIAVFQTGSTYQCAAKAREVFDVSGAGDTVIATLAAAFSCGLDLYDCAQLANTAAGIVIGKVGTVTISRDELLVTLSKQSLTQVSDKVCSLEQVRKTLAVWRAEGERVVFTNGCFDLLHLGHVKLLESAKQEGDRLVVGLNSDRSVRLLKGPDRPVLGEIERAQMLAAMSPVDAVVIFDDETPLNLIRAIRPDVLVKGADYKEHQVVGGSEVRSWGGRVALIPLVEGHSTTKLLTRLTR